MPTCPAATVRVEAASNLTSTVSFGLLEVGAGREAPRLSDENERR